MSGQATKLSKVPLDIPPIRSEMTLSLQIPTDVVENLRSKWSDVSRGALEATLADGYRSNLLSTEQISRSLGLESRFDVDEFLKNHEIPTSTAEDFDNDVDALDWALEEYKP